MAWGSRPDRAPLPAAQSGEKQGKVTKLSKNEVLMLNIGSMCTGARVLAVRRPLWLCISDVTPRQMDDLHDRCVARCGH